MARVRLGANYVRLWTGATVSNLGDGVTLAAVPLLATTLTRSPTSIAVVSLAMTLPWLLFALVGGALADRLDRRKTMAAVDAFRMVAIGTLAGFVLAGEESLALIVVVAFVLGTAETLFDNASQAILPNVVPKEHLETANGRLYAAEIVTNQFVGPPLGAFLFTVAAAAPFLLDAGSFGLAALAVLGMRGSFRPVRAAATGASGDGASEPRPSIRADIAEGVRWLRRHRLLRTLALALAVLNLLASAVFAVLVLYALEVLDLSQRGYGVLLTAGGIGALLGSLLARALSSRVGPGTVLVISMVAIGAAMLVPALWANPIALGLGLALEGGFSVAWNVVTVSLRQAIVPDALLGRVNSAYRLVGWGTMPIGALLGGVLARTFGLRAPFLVAGVVPIVMGLALIPALANRRITEARAEAGVR
jgi:MFS family permease